MAELAGPLFVFAGLLIAGGVSKGVSPQAGSGALRAMGLPSSLALVRSLGVVEVAVGAAVILTGLPAASLALAAFYLGFTAFVVVALVRDLPIGSCGCFGRDDTPPTWLHAGFDVAATGFGLAGALSPIGSPSEWLAELDSLAVPYVIFTLAALLFSYMVLGELPKTMAVAQRNSAAGTTGGGA